MVKWEEEVERFYQGTADGDWDALWPTASVSPSAIWGRLNYPGFLNDPELFMKVIDEVYSEMRRRSLMTERKDKGV